MKRFRIKLHNQHFKDLTDGKWYRLYDVEFGDGYVIGSLYNNDGVLKGCGTLDNSSKYLTIETTETVNDEPLHRLTAIGDTFYNKDGVELEVVSSHRVNCDGCFYDYDGCDDFDKIPCLKDRIVIYKKLDKQK